jgi:Peptidase family C25/Propeptide_C25/Dockerin type I domain
MKQGVKISALRSAIVLLALTLILIPGSNSMGQQAVSLEVQSAEYNFLNMENGQQIRMDGFGFLNCPGKPLLPEKRFVIGLPPGARVQSVEITGGDSIELPIRYNIIPSPHILPLESGEKNLIQSEKMLREWTANKEAIYSSDQAYPKMRGKLIGSGTIRKYSYVTVSFYPFSYYPKSCRLIHYNSARISISYDLPTTDSPEMQMINDLKSDTLADAQASRLLINYQQIKDLYEPTEDRSHDRQDNYDYIILTAGSLIDAISSSDFLDWKASLGYNVQIAYIDDTNFAKQSGRDLAEQIRNYLRENYGAWGTEFVLIVGDYETIPMRYCFPDPFNHVFYPYDPFNYGGETPTDYYYADLSLPDAEGWDSDGDGYYGEYGQDNPDFMADVYVGRIPTNDTARITYTLNKIVDFEQDTGGWKNSALHAGTILFFENQDHTGDPLTDGSGILDFIEINQMPGWTISHYTEQDGLAPSEFVWPAVSMETFTADWRQGEYGMVTWAAHGSAHGAGRSVWSYDDGDGVPESSEITIPGLINIWAELEDDHPSIVFAVSCNVGYPEENAYGRLGVDLLVKPTFGSAVGVVSAARGAAVAINWDSIPGGAGSICYEFNRYLINGPDGAEKLGCAIYDSKFFCNQNYGWDHYYEYKNLYDFNLYGDPSLVREGIILFKCGDANNDDVINVSDAVHIINYVFVGGDPPDPIESGDVNCDSVCNVSDAVWIINYVFVGGNEPCDTDGDTVPDC